MAKTPYAGKRERSACTVEIDEPLASLQERASRSGLPLWLPAGSVRLLYSDSGCDEDDALWSDSDTGAELFGRPDVEVFWTTTSVDAGSGRSQAALLVPGLAVGMLDVGMEAQADGTRVRFDLSCTAISEAGHALFDGRLGERMGRLLERFGRTLATAPVPSKLVPCAATQRRTVTYEILIEGDVDECFPLACPVAEIDWIDGWQFDLIYADSGRNETGCVFFDGAVGLSVLRDASALNCWHTTLFDAEQHLFEAVWMTGDHVIARWKCAMSDLGGGRTRVTWSLVWTGLRPEGSRMISEPGFEQRTKRALGFIAISLKRYVETGSIYRLSTGRKLKVAGALIGAALGRHFRRVRGRSGSTTPQPTRSA